MLKSGIMHLVVIAHNIRSTHNVGSIFRTCDGFGVDKLYLTGYTPYPSSPGDNRLPHLAEKLTKQISKTALGAEKVVAFGHADNPVGLIKQYQKDGFTIAALEQSHDSILLPEFSQIPKKLVLLLGEEVHGIPPDLLEMCDVTLEIPMVGKKESFNVSVAAGIALYAITI